MCDLGISRGDLRLSGSIIRKSRFIFTEEPIRAKEQKSGCLNHSYERIFLVYLLMQGRIMGSWKWGPYVQKRCGGSLC